MHVPNLSYRMHVPNLLYWNEKGLGVCNVPVPLVQYGTRL